MAEEARLTIRIDPDKRKALRDKATSEGKTVTDVLTAFINEYLDISQVSNSVEERVARLEKIIEEKLEASLGELAA